MSELRGLGDVHRKLQAIGGTLVAISVDPPAKAREVVRKQALEFPVLCDVDRSVIQDYGLVHEGGGPGGSDIAIPAHVLVDRNMKIRWLFRGSRVQDRPEPSEVMNAVLTLN